MTDLLILLACPLVMQVMMRQGGHGHGGHGCHGRGGLSEAPAKQHGRERGPARR